MFIGKDFVFVDIPKTGSTSILKVLTDNFEALRQHRRRHDPNIPPLYGKLPAFCTIRHPYDRLYSLYWATCIREKRKHIYGYLEELDGNVNFYNFLKIYHFRRQLLDADTYFNREGFLRSVHVIPQSEYLDRAEYDYILRFENLQEDFNNLPFIDNLYLPMLNATTAPNRYDSRLRPPTEEIITQKEKDLIYDLFPNEFEPLGYER